MIGRFLYRPRYWLDESFELLVGPAVVIFHKLPRSSIIFCVYQHMYHRSRDATSIRTGVVSISITDTYM